MKYKNPGDMFNAMKSGKITKKKKMAHSKQAVAGLSKFIKEEKGEKMKKKAKKVIVKKAIVKTMKKGAKKKMVRTAKTVTKVMSKAKKMGKKAAC